MARQLRSPVSPEEFAGLKLPAVKKVLRAPWWNLRWQAHAEAGQTFFASKSGRLMPESGKVSCLYLARNRETSFYELYGDDIDAAEKRDMRYRFRRAELEQRIFLKTPAGLTVRVYDLTTQRSAKAIGLDLGTLYSSEVEFARAFAQRLHDHPARFDGIQYVSRHTQTPCLVLWPTHTPALKALTLEPSATLWELARYEPGLPPGALRVLDSVVDVAGAPG